MMDIAAKVRALVAARLGGAAIAAPDEARFVEDLHAASLDMVELVMSIEDEFGVEISDATSEKLKTIADVVRFLETKRAERPSKAPDQQPGIGA